MKIRAAINEPSIEEKAHQIPRAAPPQHAPQPDENLAEAARRLFDSLGGVDLTEVSRISRREPPTFD